MGHVDRAGFLIANNGGVPQSVRKVDNYIFHWFGDCGLKVKLERLVVFAQACIMNEGDSSSAAIGAEADFDGGR